MHACSLHFLPICSGQRAAWCSVLGEGSGDKNIGMRWHPWHSGRLSSSTGTSCTAAPARVLHAGAFVTDVTNAARTNLMELATQRWHPPTMELFGVREGMLPEIRSCAEHLGTIQEGPLEGVSITGAFFSLALRSYIWRSRSAHVEAARRARWHATRDPQLRRAPGHNSGGASQGRTHHWCVQSLAARLCLDSDGLPSRWSSAVCVRACCRTSTAGAFFKSIAWILRLALTQRWHAPT